MSRLSRTQPPPLSFMYPSMALATNTENQSSALLSHRPITIHEWHHFQSIGQEPMAFLRERVIYRTFASLIQYTEHVVANLDSMIPNQIRRYGPFHVESFQIQKNNRENQPLTIDNWIALCEGDLITIYYQNHGTPWQNPWPAQPLSFMYPLFQHSLGLLIRDGQLPPPPPPPLPIRIPEYSQFLTTGLSTTMRREADVQLHLNWPSWFWYTTTRRAILAHAPPLEIRQNVLHTQGQWFHVENFYLLRGNNPQQRETLTLDNYLRLTLNDAVLVVYANYGRPWRNLWPLPHMPPHPDDEGTPPPELEDIPP